MTTPPSPPQTELNSSTTHSRYLSKIFIDPVSECLVNSSNSFDNRAGLLPATKPLEMCLYLVRETEIVPWAAALRHLGQWKLTLQETEVLSLINAFVQHIIGPIYNTIGWEDKGTHMEK